MDAVCSQATDVAVDTVSSKAYSHRHNYGEYYSCYQGDTEYAPPPFPLPLLAFIAHPAFPHQAPLLYALLEGNMVSTFRTKWHHSCSEIHCIYHFDFRRRDQLPVCVNFFVLQDRGSTRFWFSGFERNRLDFESPALSCILVVFGHFII